MNADVMIAAGYADKRDFIIRLGITLLILK